MRFDVLLAPNSNFFSFFFLQDLYAVFVKNYIYIILFLKIMANIIDYINYLAFLKFWIEKIILCFHNLVLLIGEIIIIVIIFKLDKDLHNFIFIRFIKTIVRLISSLFEVIVDSIVVVSNLRIALISVRVYWNCIEFLYNFIWVVFLGWIKNWKFFCLCN